MVSRHDFCVLSWFSDVLVASSDVGAWLYRVAYCKLFFRWYRTYLPNAILFVL